MNDTRFQFRKYVLFLVSIVFLLMCVTPAHAYYFGQWKTDGFFKSQFGVFTEKKPYNKAQYGFSDDNISTARQSFRWNLEGQISEQFALRAEVQGSLGTGLSGGNGRNNDISTQRVLWKPITTTPLTGGNSPLNTNPIIPIPSNSDGRSSTGVKPCPAGSLTSVIRLIPGHPPAFCLLRKSTSRCGCSAGSTIFTHFTVHPLNGSQPPSGGPTGLKLEEGLTATPRWATARQRM